MRELIIERKEILLGTNVTIKVIESDLERAIEAIKSAFNEIRRIEEIMSEFRGDSEVSILNHAKFIKNPSKDLVYVLRKSEEYFEISDGAFDIMASTKPRPRMTIKDDEIRVNCSSKINISLGGIAKGYAVDKAIEVLQGLGIRRALIDAGGDIRVLDGKSDKHLWTIGIRDPTRKESFTTMIKLFDKSVATSGTYGKTKIIDPRTGELIKDPVSATVIADKAIDADTLSTLSIISPEIGLRIVKRLGFEALIIYQSGKILKTSGFKGYEV